MSRTDLHTGRHGSPTHAEPWDFHTLGNVLCPVVLDSPSGLKPSSEPALSTSDKALLAVIGENQALRGRVAILEAVGLDLQNQLDLLRFQVSAIVTGLKAQYPAESLAPENPDDE